MGALANSFEIPSHLNAKMPIEWTRGRRDQVGMMVLHARSGKTIHTQFRQLADFLQSGDLLLFNNSRTIPAVLKGADVEIRLSRKREDELWEAILLTNKEEGHQDFVLEGNLHCKIVGKGSEEPLQVLSFSKEGGDFFDHLYRFGQPIRYEYIDSPWPLDYYQTVFASAPGSVEMPSAGRAFSWEMLKGLKEKGVQTEFLQLHAGLSYYENNQWPNPKHHPEAFQIPRLTAQRINETKANGGRIVAVGTTVVRAVESAVNDYGKVCPGKGLTTLYIQQDYERKIVDGLITGFHEPQASHLHLLTSFVEESSLILAYQEALGHGYLWHEFGDMNLILP
ncbi:S-adenosylmethionine:tRNA ribosyltransferase-isomerase [Bacillus spongiae]|uniref:S-adenosylmethionine:tRNA ribosyltransferase-isomerase n=1 Tax=Bacillus spongiae TaxID=2683610 RepID=A0ABU8HI53_9BACI